MTVPILPAGRPDTIQSVVSILRSGGVIAVPTDTVYGLVCLFDHDKAVRDIFRMKDRPPGEALPLLLGSAAELPLVTTARLDTLWPLVYAFWPGPLTIILPAHPSLLPAVTGGKRTVGLRVPNHPAVLDLLEAIGLPFASTSANLHGRPPIQTGAEIATAFGSRLGAVIEAETLPHTSMASTVLDLTTTPALIRRQGSITPTQIRDTMGARVDLAPSSS